MAAFSDENMQVPGVVACCISIQPCRIEELPGDAAAFSAGTNDKKSSKGLAPVRPGLAKPFMTHHGMIDDNVQ